LIELGICSKKITVPRLLRLNRGLLQLNMLMDGFNMPYLALIPFLTLGCLRLEKLERGEQPENALDEDDFKMKCVVLDVLVDTANILSAMKSMPRPAAEN
jgi:hypothetical protein